MPSSSRPSIALEQILAERAWLASLVRDVADGEDVAQEAIIAAMRWPPEQAPAIRSWLRRVVRTLAYRRSTAERRRALRERTAARPEADVAPADVLLQQVEAHEHVAAAVRRLAEPYRGTVIRRYFEGLAIPAIAEIRGIPESTVRTHLSRALAQIREDMARQNGPEWRLAWIPFLALEQRSRAASASEQTYIHGGLLSSGIVKFVLGLSVVVLGVVGVWTIWSFGDQGSSIQPSGSSSVSQQSDAALGTVTSAVDTPARDKATSSLNTPPGEVAYPRVSGRAVDDRGRALANVQLMLTAPESPQRRGSAASATELQDIRPVTDELGRFTLNLPSGACDVVSAPGRITLYAGSLPTRRTDRELLVVAVPAIEIAGRVLDRDRRPLAGARLRFDAWNLGQLALDPSASAARATPATETDTEGRFRFEAAPGTRQVRLQVERSGFKTVSIPCPESTILALDITLDANAPDSAGLQVHITDKSGRALEGAAVSFGGSTVHADRNGLVLLPWPDHDQESILVAAHHKFAPQVCRNYSYTQWKQDGKPASVEIQLNEPSSVISGTLELSDGNPLKGWNIALQNGVYLSVSTLGEGVAAGRPAARAGDFGVSGEKGAFRLEGLARHPYVLRFYDPITLASFTTDPIEAGSQGITVRVPGDLVSDRVRMRVVDREGAPIPEVTARFLLFTASGAKDRAERSESPPISDAQGWIELQKVPRRDAFVVLEGDAITTHIVKVGDVVAQAESVVVAPRRIHVRILPPETSRDGVVVMIDENGEPVNLQQLCDGRFRLIQSWEFSLGPSPVLIIPDTVRAIRYVGGPEAGNEDPITLNTRGILQLNTR